MEKREPFLPIAAKVGVKAGIMAGKKIFFDKRDVHEVEKRDAEAEPVWALPLAAKVGIKAGILAGKKIFFDKRDLEEFEKREAALPVIPIAAKVGWKAGLQAGKELFFDKRDAFIEFNPSDDDPFNPFDDPGVIGKRALPLAAKVGIKAGLQLGKELFFDKRDALTVAEGSDLPTEWDGIPGYGKRDALLTLPVINDFNGDGNRFSDVRPKLNPIDFADLPEKRDAELNFIENAVRWWAKEATDDDPMNPFDDPGLPGKRDAEPNFIENAVRWWAKEATDDDPMNPFDDPGLPGKRDAQPQEFKAGLPNPVQWWGKKVTDGSIKPFQGLPAKRNAEAEPFIKDVLNKVLPQDENDDTSFNPLDGTLNIFKREAEAEAKPFIKDVLNKVLPQDENDDTSFNPLDGTLNIFKV